MECMSVIVLVVSAIVIFGFMYIGRSFGKIDLFSERRGRRFVSYVKSRGVFFAHITDIESGILVETLKSKNLIDLQKEVHRCYK